MKKLFALLLTAVIAAAFTACAGQNTASDSPASDAPTQQPYIATPVDEPEWTYPDGELKLEDSNTVYAMGQDFICFAIVGAEKESMELRFMLDDATATKLAQNGSGGPYRISFNDQPVGTATLSDDCKIATVTSADATDDITVLATLIRGVG